MKTVDALRNEMQKAHMDAYLIVSDDFHGSEYVGDYFKCREYVSGFDGSAGTLVITREEAGLWTDGRYFIQAQEQLEGTGIKLFKMGEPDVPTVFEYLEQTLEEGSCLGYDGRTVCVSYGKQIKEKLAKKNISFSEGTDLVDRIWKDRPALSHEPVWILEDTFAGVGREKKLADLREKMKLAEADYHLIASLDDIAWLYNMRGNDIAYNPVALSYTLMDNRNQKAILYLQEDALGGRERRELEKDGITIRPYFAVYEDIRKLGMDENCPESKNVSLMIDEAALNIALYSAIPEHIQVINRKNPTTLAKAVKNPVEMKNERKAHIKDGVAVTKLLYWLKKIQHTDTFRDGQITELMVGERLLDLRKEQEGFIEQSFAPIIATGAHGAIVHYEPTPESDRPIENHTFLLMDTGGQYYEGTTDITRTIIMGNATPLQKHHYTAVLRGNLNLAAACFKEGVTGVNLDYLARSPLWKMGLDYNHGTGHGVGYLLNVHEGPNGIRLKEAEQKVGVPLEEGMITSDEPGLYLEGQYGIRLENLILCVKDKKTEMGQFLKFDTLTMVPFDKDAIMIDDMTRGELRHLNEYHQMVYEVISPYLTKEERDWLYEVTRPLVKEN